MMALTTLLKIPHHGGMSVSINPHESVYETVEQYTFDQKGYWVSDEQRDKAIAENRLVEVQWYPDSPVGFYRAAGADLDQVVAHILVGLAEGSYS